MIVFRVYRLFIAPYFISRRSRVSRGNGLHTAKIPSLILTEPSISLKSARRQLRSSRLPVIILSMRFCSKIWRFNEGRVAGRCFHLDGSARTPGRYYPRRIQKLLLSAPWLPYACTAERRSNPDKRTGLRAIQTGSSDGGAALLVCNESGRRREGLHGK
jgi:hypothetical protein